MVRATRRSRARQPTLLFRLIFAGGFLALSTSEVGHYDGASQSSDPGKKQPLVLARSVDPTATGGIAALRPQHINRAIKENLLIARRPAPRPISAGVVGTVGLFAPVEDNLPRIAFFVSPAVVPGAVAEAEPQRRSRNRKKADTLAVAKADPAAAVPVVAAYAPADTNEDANAPFDAVIAKPTIPQSAIVVPNVDAAHAWVNNPLPATIKSESEIKCLATALYFEARGEPERGQLAVAQVVLNRVKNPAYPNTICSVVYQNKLKRNRCQFSFACDGVKDRVTDSAAWAKADTLARRVVADSTGTFMADVGEATHYHATYVRPRWARKMKKMEKIGRHIFYKTYGGGWS